MVSFERFRSGELNSKEQAAFQNAADALVFDTPEKIPLSRRNIPKIVEVLEKQFGELDERHEEGKQKYIEHAVETMQRQLSELIPSMTSERVPMAPEPQHVVERPLARKERVGEDTSLTGKFTESIQMYLTKHHLDDSSGYGAWGFTPKLAGMRTQDKGFEFGTDGRNCFGFVQSIAPLVRKFNIPFEMGITADHPFIVAEVEGKTYLASNGGVQETKGTFEQKDGYRIYKPAPEDGLLYELMVVWKYDEAVVYEVLENLEVLRQMSLGGEVDNLPGTEEAGKKLAEQNKNILQGASWRGIQEKLVPGLTQYFRAEKEPWSEEIARVALIRATRVLFKKAMEVGQSATSLKALSFEEFKKQFLPRAKEYKDAISDFIISGKEFPPETPEDIVNFATQASSVMKDAFLPELREKTLEMFLHPFLTGRPDLTLD